MAEATLEKGTSNESSENGKESSEAKKRSTERRERSAKRRAVKRSKMLDFKTYFLV